MATDIPQQYVPTVNESEALVPEFCPNVDHLITEDDTPVDNIFSEKQQRLLTEALYASWKPTVPFLVMANVGLFHAVSLPPFVPDVLLSLDVEAPANLFPKSHRSYFVWEYGKPPNVVIEVVSNREGKEDTDKLKGYARIGVNFYIIYDPERKLSSHRLRFFELRGGEFQLLDSAAPKMPQIGLGVMIWTGSFEGHVDEWLRWTDLNGQLIATGAELASIERERAESERERAETAMRLAEDASRRAEKLSDQLRRLGISPEA